MLSIARFLPLPGARAARALNAARSSQQAVECLKRDAATLTRSWIGRRVIVERFTSLRAQLTQQQVSRIWHYTLSGASSAPQLWSLWKELAAVGICQKPTADWRMRAPLPEPSPRSFKQIGLYSLHFLRSRLEILLFYFDIRSKQAFAVQNLWELESRFNSIIRVFGAATSLISCLYQSYHLAGKAVVWLGCSHLLWAKAALIGATALLSIGLLGTTFYVLRKLLNLPPLEIDQCENLNLSALKSSFPFVESKEQLEQLQRLLLRKEAGIIWISGPEGSGKSSILRECVRRMAAHSTLSPDRQPPRVFLTDGATLMSAAAYTTPVTKFDAICNQLKGYEKQVVLAIDECHLLSPDLIERLKAWKDRRGGRLVLITNDEPSRLAKRWGEASWRSLKSHTVANSICLGPATESKLQAIVKRTLASQPDLDLEPAAQRLLVTRCVRVWRANPRLLSEMLGQLIHRSKSEMADTRQTLHDELTGVRSELWHAQVAGRQEEVVRLTEVVADKEHLLGSRLEQRLKCQQRWEEVQKAQERATQIVHWAISQWIQQPTQYWLQGLLSSVTQLPEPKFEHARCLSCRELDQELALCSGISMAPSPRARSATI